MKTSILIPSRNEPLLAKTVDDIFAKARGDFEVIVIIDENDQTLEPREGLRVVKKEGPPGMKSAINQAVNLAEGEFLLKTDAHCMFDEGFDVKLQENCEDDWVVIPRRYSLDGEKWEIKPNRPIIDYEFVTFPYRVLTSVRHGGKWWERIEARKDILIDDNMCFQGSCWFMKKQHYLDIDGLEVNPETGDDFVLESEEIALKTWLSGGRVVVNKNTWYAHLHKGNQWGRGYKLDREAAKRQRLFHINYWMHNQWPKAIYTMKWLVNKFWPIPTWPEDWEDPKYEEIFRTENRVDKKTNLDYVLTKYQITEKGIHKLMCSRTWTLPHLFKDLGFKVGAEIGVERAVYSKTLVRTITGLKLYGVDPWLFYEGYRDHVPQERLDEFYEASIRRMEGYDFHPIRKFSMDAVKDFDDESLDFVYIDANHDYEHAKEDIREWHKKVRKGGIVSGHDYRGDVGVKQAVNEWVQEQKIDHLFILKKDNSPSWFYVRT